MTHTRFAIWTPSQSNRVKKKHTPSNDTRLYNSSIGMLLPFPNHTLSWGVHYIYINNFFANTNGQESLHPGRGGVWYSDPDTYIPLLKVLPPLFLTSFPHPRLWLTYMFIYILISLYYCMIITKSSLILV